MKPKRLILTLAAMLLVSLRAFAQSNEPMKGDVNGDGNIDDADIYAIEKIIHRARGITGKKNYLWYFGTEKLTTDAEIEEKGTIISRVSDIPFPFLIEESTYTYFYYPSDFGNATILDEGGWPVAGLDIMDFPDQVGFKLEKYKGWRFPKDNQGVYIFSTFPNAITEALNPNNPITEEESKGDLNEDGVVDIADIVFLNKILAENGGNEKEESYYWYIGTSKLTTDNEIEANGMKISNKSDIPNEITLESDDFVYLYYPISFGLAYGWKGGKDASTLSNVSLTNYKGWRFPKGNSGWKLSLLFADVQKLRVKPIEELSKNRSTEIVINLEDAGEATALQFNLKLPEGVTLAQSGENYGAVLGSATDGHTLSVETLDSGDLLFVLYSADLNTFMDGELLRLPLRINDGTTPLKGKLYTIRTATADAVSKVCEDVTFSVAVEQELVFGDVNGDGDVNLVDVTMTVSHILGQTPEGFVEAAADIDGNNVVDIQDLATIIDIALKKSM